jgi:hypothetical protein
VRIIANKGSTYAKSLEEEMSVDTLLDDCLTMKGCDKSDLEGLQNKINVVYYVMRTLIVKNPSMFKELLEEWAYDLYYDVRIEE